jgi:hypothetical protein
MTVMLQTDTQRGPVGSSLRLLKGTAKKKKKNKGLNINFAVFEKNKK